MSITKRLFSAVLAIAFFILPSAQFSGSPFYAAAVGTESQADEDSDIYAFPDELPTAIIPSGLKDGDYVVPVYLYNIMQDAASMGNGALDHEATLSIKDDAYTVHLTFHDMPFLDAYGHLEMLWYYDTNDVDHEVTVDESEWIYFEETKSKVKTIRKCSFVLPANSAETKCRVKVDAMGDSEQDARIVFDFSSLGELLLPIDTSSLEEKLDEANSFSNDDGKYTDESFNNLRDAIDYAVAELDSDNLTEEDVEMLIGILQDGIDGLTEVPQAADSTALEAKVAEASLIVNEDNKYTAESFSKLQEQIALAKSLIGTSDLTQDMADKLIVLIQQAIDGLVEKNETTETTASVTTTETTTTETTTTETPIIPSREDGVYTANVKFITLEGVEDENGFFVLKPTNEENDVLNEIFGSTIKLTIENNNYTATLTSKGSENSDYYYGYIMVIWTKGGSAPQVTYENAETSTHNGDEYTTLVNGTVASFEMRDPNEVEFYQYLFTKETDEKKRFAIQMVVDYDSLVKVGEVGIDKSDLQYEIEFAEYIISSEADKYTADSIQIYQFYLDEAKKAYESDAVTQVQVRKATQNLKDAWEACKPVSETTTTIETTTTTTETTTTTTSTTTTITTETTTTATTNNNIASDDDLCQWAINDYKDKIGVTPAKAEITDTADGNYAITLTDADGNILDTYVINPETGVGTNSASEEVNLPQTGNHSLFRLSIVLGAFALIGAGFITMFKSGMVKRKKNC